MRPKPKAKSDSLKDKRFFSKLNLSLFVFVFAAVGGYILLSSHAAELPNTTSNPTSQSANSTKVNPEQLSELLSNYGQTTNQSRSDIDGDGKVTVSDLSKLLSSYSR